MGKHIELTRRQYNGAVIYIVLLGSFNVLYPGFQQKFIVNPNELQKVLIYFCLLKIKIYKPCPLVGLKTTLV